MALRFEQANLPPGVNHVLIDDGEDIVHVFNECARWCDVAEAAGIGSSVYAATKWRRLDEAERGDRATPLLRRLRRRLSGRTQGARSGQRSS